MSRGAGGGGRAGGSPVDRRVIGVGVGIPLLMLAAFVLTELGIGGDDEGGAVVTTTVASDPPASTAPLAVDEAWNTELESALQPLGEAIPQLSDAVRSWDSGELADAALIAVLDELEPLFAGVRSAVASLPAHPEDELAAPLVEQMGRLYVLAVDAHRSAVAASDEATATQYDRLGRRLRVLGDRVFDRARERTAVAFDPGEGVELRLPAQIPDWTRLGLAVGPPLEPRDANVDKLPLQREEERRSQPAAAWEDRVEDLGTPTTQRVGRALEAGDPGELAQLARELVAAAEALRSIPVPDGDPGRADRLALAWLVRSDAVRAAQLRALSGAEDGDGELSRSLLEISDVAALTGA